MQNSKMIFYIVILLLLTATGCATITRGTTDTLFVDSKPTGADVTLSNGMTGKTPATFKLPRKESLVVKIKREGYEVVTVSVKPQISGAGGAGMAGNVVLGGLVGAAVDAGSGAMYNLIPNPIEVELVPLQEPLDGPNSEHLEDLNPAPLEDSRKEKSDSSIEIRLKALQELRNEGLISEEEYKIQKALLDEL